MRGDERAGRLRPKTDQRQLRQPRGVDGGGLAAADGQDHRDGIGQQPAGGEHDRARGRPVEPLDVVDHHQHRRRLGEHVEQPERRRAHQIALGTGGLGQPERAAEGSRLRARQAVECAEHGTQQLVQAAEGDLDLGLDAARPQHDGIAGGRHRVIEQRALADARFAANHERRALSHTHTRKQGVDLLALGNASEQHPPILLRRREAPA